MIVVFQITLLIFIAVLIIAYRCSNRCTTSKVLLTTSIILDVLVFVAIGFSFIHLPLVVMLMVANYALNIYSLIGIVAH